jgi:hypothetical protein
LKALRTSEEAKNQTLVIVSSPMTWSNTPVKAEPYSDKDLEHRVPLPKFLPMKQLEKAAMALPKQNPRVKVHVLCTGFLYGNGE